MVRRFPVTFEVEDNRAPEGQAVLVIKCDHHTRRTALQGATVEEILDRLVGLVDTSATKE